jgi:2,4-dienoyl-CoA reductase-like NADH-dependent reductase (Old Yellow Enzyme family)
MCQYSSHDEHANDWHFVHLGSRAVGGADLVLTEATAVLAEGRISPEDLGIRATEHIDMLTRIISFIHEQGSIAGMELAHAGRKGRNRQPWEAPGKFPKVKLVGKKVVAPSALAFTNNYPMPQALTSNGISRNNRCFCGCRPPRLPGWLPCPQSGVSKMEARLSTAWKPNSRLHREIGDDAILTCTFP